MNAANTLRIIGSVCDFLILHDWRCFENIYTHPFFVIVVLKKKTVSLLITLWHQMCGFFPHINFVTLWTQTGCPTIAFISETIYLELLSDSTALRPRSHSTSFSSDSATVLGPCGTTLLFHLAAKRRVPHTPPDWIISHDGSPNSETFTYVYQFIIKDIIQDREEQPYKEVRSEGTESRNFCPQGVGVHPPSPQVDVFTIPNPIL